MEEDRARTATPPPDPSPVEGAERPRRRRSRASATPYRQWQQGERIPSYTGSFLDSLYDLELKPWARFGQDGAFVNLAEQEADDGWLIEIAPGGRTEPTHHMFEAGIFVVHGRGATSFWQPGKPKQTVEWQRGSILSPPLNSSYQHFNLDGQRPARLFAVTNAPMVMNLYRNPGFVFGCDYVFDDRYAGQDDYFSARGEQLEEQLWKTNLIPDIRSFTLKDQPGRGYGNLRMGFLLANNQMAAHCSDFPPGTYKAGHRHGVGAHVIVLGGQGYSLLWFDGEERRRVDWQDGSVLSPKEGEFHQHFNTGSTPARYLAFRLGALDPRRLAGEEGGLPDQIEYEDEDPLIFDIYAAECARNGAQVVLPRPVRR